MMDLKVRWRKYLASFFVTILCITFSKLGFPKFDSFLRDFLQFFNPTKISSNIITVNIDTKDPLFKRPVSLSAIEQLVKKIKEGHPSKIVLLLEPGDIKENNIEATEFLKYINSESDLFLSSAVSRPGKDSFKDHPILRKAKNFYSPPRSTSDENIEPRDQKTRRTNLFFENIGEDEALKESEKLGITPKPVEYYRYFLKLWNTKQVYFKTFKVGTFGHLSSNEILETSSLEHKLRDKIVLISAFDEFSFFSKPSIFNLFDQRLVDDFERSYYPYQDYIANILYLYISGDYIKDIQTPDILILFFLSLFLVFINISFKSKLLIFLSFVPVIVLVQVLAYMSFSVYLNLSRSLAQILFVQVFILPILFFWILSEQEKNKIHEINTAKFVALESVSEKLAHDIRSPLSTINLMLGKASFLEPEHKQIIKSAVKRIDEMTEDILSENRMEKSAIEVNQTISKIFSEIRTVNPKIKFIFKSCEPTIINFNKTAFERLIINILDNSIHAISHEDGQITVLLKKETSKLLKILISDNGSGMDETILNVIGSQKVTSSKPNGNGIGLYHSKNLLAKYSGKLEISSEKNKGTSVSIFLEIMAG